MKTLCIHAIIHGKVQGVFYRDSARRQAQSLEVTGWIKNNVDGTVELTACGEPEKVRLFIDWLHQGPPAATVTNVNWHEIPNEAHEGFVILR